MVVSNRDIDINEPNNKIITNSILFRLNICIDNKLKMHIHA